MIKQRKDSISQFEAGNRQDLADIEKAELAILAAYMPAGLSDEEIAAEVAAAVAASGAAGPQDMGKVMAIVKPKLAGRADMTVVSALVKKALTRRLSRDQTSFQRRPESMVSLPGCDDRRRQSRCLRIVADQLCSLRGGIV